MARHHELCPVKGLNDGTIGQLANYSGFAGEAYAVADGDFDGNGQKDIVYANNNESVISVLINASSGGSIPYDYIVQYWPDSLASGDFNADGTDDIALLYKNQKIVVVPFIGKDAYHIGIGTEPQLRLSISGYDSSISLKWRSTYATKDIAGFAVYRGRTPDATSAVLLNEVPATGNSYIDHVSSLAGTYYYFLKPVLTQTLKSGLTKSGKCYGKESNKVRFCLLDDYGALPQ